MKKERIIRKAAEMSGEYANLAMTCVNVAERIFVGNRGSWPQDMKVIAARELSNNMQPLLDNTQGGITTMSRGSIERLIGQWWNPKNPRYMPGVTFEPDNMTIFEAIRAGVFNPEDPMVMAVIRPPFGRENDDHLQAGKFIYFYAFEVAVAALSVVNLKKTTEHKPVDMLKVMFRRQ